MENDNFRKFTGIWIPRELWLDTSLGWTEKLLLAEIDSLDQDNNCYASNQYFATFFNLSKGRISKLISSLRDKGYISVTIINKEGSNEIDKRIIRCLYTYKRLRQDPMVENNNTYSRLEIEGMVESINNYNKVDNKDKNKEDNNKDILSSTEDFSTTIPLEVKENPKEKVSPKRKGKEVIVVSERDRLITSVHSSFIEYWCKDYKTDYVFASKDARAIKNIATKLHDIQLKQGNVSEDKLMVAFRLICSFIANYNDYYKSADLSTVDSKLNTIIDLIKTKQHGINQATQSEGRFSQFINKG